MAEKKKIRKTPSKKVLKDGSKDGRPLDGVEVKKSTSIRLEPSIKQKIVEKYGSVSKWVIEMCKEFI